MRGVLAAAATAAMLMAPVARAEAAPSATSLKLSISDGSQTRTVTLSCHPPGGTHPKAAQACADLQKSSANFERLPGDDNVRACFMIYAPVTVTAEGRWQGEPVRHHANYPNRCVMRSQTGSVFAF